ncbi:MAG TPA: hypothetical protein VFA16_18765 [Mycobacterium sp.]|uniref:hypothetical protein n=1 Tax=Mycobacterium sp. TaxID=1785 RepID=UPI002D3CA2D8|nr:hypothetical protein [Mycobacterium sp.]HZU49270.1 hypothetical protein [Mycobacterium sp.]
MAVQDVADGHEIAVKRFWFWTNVPVDHWPLRKLYESQSPVAKHEPALGQETAVRLAELPSAPTSWVGVHEPPEYM